MGLGGKCVACTDPLYVGAGAPLPRGEGHTFPSWGRGLGGGGGSGDFLGTPPHMRGTVTPTPRGGYAGGGTRWAGISQARIQEIYEYTRTCIGVYIVCVTGYDMCIKDDAERCVYLGMGLRVGGGGLRVLVGNHWMLGAKGGVGAAKCLSEGSLPSVTQPVAARLARVEGR